MNRILIILCILYFNIFAQAQPEIEKAKDRTVLFLMHRKTGDVDVIVAGEKVQFVLSNNIAATFIGEIDSVGANFVSINHQLILFSDFYSITRMNTTYAKSRIGSGAGSISPNAITMVDDIIKRSNVSRKRKSVSVFYSSRWHFSAKTFQYRD